MKRFFMALAAVAAMVGCQSVDEPIANVNTPAALSLSASIVTDATRVTVGGDKFTEVEWEQGDVIRLESKLGTNVELKATAAGKSDIRFEGEGSIAAEVDTYYAVYPSMNISNGTIMLNYAEQSGDDVALLVAEAKDTAFEGLEMDFRPLNALLHVAVSGVESLQKAEFMSFTGADLYSSFVYDFATDAVSYNTTSSAIVVDSPAASGFFFRLPADLDMSDGYIVRLTDGAGNVCTKAYNGKTFERGTTTRVDIAWSQPVVTLGAKTSYSYYAAGDSATANSCANTDIFFVTGKNGESCASSYAGVQDAMISDLGYEVDGTTYTYSAGQVSWDKTANTFCINENPSYSTTWGEKTAIKAFVVVDGKKYYSNNNIWLTGLPYGYNFVDGSLDAYRNAGWSTNGSLRVSAESLAGRAKTLVLNHRRYMWLLFNEHEKGYVVSPKFEVPTSVPVQPSIVHSTYNAGGDLARTTYVGAVSNTTTSNKSSITFSTSAGYSTSGTIEGKNVWQNAFTLSSSTPYISVDCNDTSGSNLGAYYFLHEAHFRYAE